MLLLKGKFITFCFFSLVQKGKSIYKRTKNEGAEGGMLRKEKVLSLLRDGKIDEAVAREVIAYPQRSKH
jgi:hypothetical protein